LDVKASGQGMTAVGIEAVRPVPRVRLRRCERARRRKGPVLSLLLLLLLLGSLGGSSSLADREERASGSDRTPTLREANGDIEAADVRERDRSRKAGLFTDVGSEGRGPLAVDNGNVQVVSRKVVMSARCSRTDAADERKSVVSSETADCSARRLALPGEAPGPPAAVAAAAGSGTPKASWERGGVVSAGTDPSVVRRASVPVS